MNVSDFYAQSGVYWNNQSWQKIDIPLTLKKTGLLKEWFKGKKCLDAGCGWGRNAIPLALLGAKVVGIDIYDFSRVKKRAEEYGVEIDFEYADVRCLPFENESFDFVICEGVIHHLNEYKKAFEELCRVTKKGGILILGVYGKGSLVNKFFFVLRRFPNFLKTPLLKMGYKGHLLYDFLAVPIVHTFKEQEIKDWFEQKGFNCERIRLSKPRNALLFGEGWLEIKGEKK